MGRNYNVIDRLRRKNERPTITIDEEHVYKINTSKTNILGIMQLVKQSEKKKDDIEGDFKLSDEIIRLALGKEALEYITTLDPTMAFTTYIIDVIMAAIEDKELNDEDNKEKK